MASCREMNPDGSYALAVSFAPGDLPGWDVRLNTDLSREHGSGGRYGGLPLNHAHTGRSSQVTTAPVRGKASGNE